ncbi:hypothetical protein A3Q56_00170 [Intoshia linei]|uniref:Aspartic peptidase DDI1-type domain-containing protein n=1 Tax=Intoshia linei TaxID=1819745 RepID=A0A177BCM3_9BILA|nr:hypothetical protein A3Q56_00170 [Intoshia linei]
MIICIFNQDSFHNIEVAINSSIQDLEEKCKTLFNFKQVTLIYNGKTLDSKLTIQNCAINEYDLIQVLPNNLPKKNSIPPTPTASTLQTKIDKMDFTNVNINGESQSSTTNSFKIEQSMRHDLIKNKEKLLDVFLTDTKFWLKLITLFPGLKSEILNHEDEFNDFAIRILQSKSILTGRAVKAVLSRDMGQLNKVIENKQEIDNNMTASIEFTPESYVNVVLLFVDCSVNNVHIRALIDTGCQSTIMNDKIAEKCNIMHLCDERFSTVAKGIGTKHTGGKIHLAEIEIGSEKYHTSLTILKDMDMEVIIGLDLMMRHRCIIDLNQRKLLFGSSNNFVSFLPESQIGELLHKMGQLGKNKSLK